MSTSFLIGLASILPTLLVVYYAPQLGRILKVIDHPDGQRKRHLQSTPMVGGIAFAITFCVVAILWWATDIPLGIFGPALICGALIYFGVGFADDRGHVSPMLRLIVLGATAALVPMVEPSLLLSNLNFHSLGMTVSLGFMAIPFTVFTLLCFQNAANMADGLNGLFLGLTLVWVCLMAPFLHGGFINYFSSIGIVALVLLVPNLRGRLFTGDSGAYLVSFLICMGSIGLYNSHNGLLPAEYMAAAFLLPVLDMGRMLITRLFDGEDPFKGDHSHFHHVLVDLTGSKGIATISYLALNMVPIVYFLQDTVSIPALMAVQISVYGFVLIYVSKKPPPSETH